jgi:hypothetical protein
MTRYTARDLHTLHVSSIPTEIIVTLYIHILTQHKSTANKALITHNIVSEHPVALIYKPVQKASALRPGKKVAYLGGGRGSIPNPLQSRPLVITHT